jgi:8-oxo-dGTP pyrophosphatase MutT (NUDIX family)
MSAVDERPIRRAASVVCVRADEDGEPEVLVVRRSPESRFLPGYVAFPGGAVDAGDAAHAERWFGDPALAPRAAAVRELVEEAGITLTATGLVASDGFGPTDVAPPSPEQLSALCHWVAPPDVPVRFDARYFTVEADAEVQATPDGAEVTALWWTTAKRLLEEWREGSHKLYWPTWLTVTELAACRSVAEVRDLRFETRDPTPDEEATMPRHVMEQE